MAKAALGWSNQDLAARTGLHRNTVHKAEKGTTRPATLALLRQAFEAAGLALRAEDEPSATGGPGVRLPR